MKLLIIHYTKSDKLSNDKKLTLMKIGGDCDVKIQKVDYTIIVLEYFILKLKKLLI